MQQTQPPDKLANHFRAVFSGSVGNLVEWYDMPDTTNHSKLDE